MEVFEEKGLGIQNIEFLTFKNDIYKEENKLKIHRSDTKRTDQLEQAIKCEI